MRPGHSVPGRSRRLRQSLNVGVAGFNEAGALSPRKISKGLKPSFSIAASFNEAGALSPRKMRKAIEVARAYWALQ